MRTKNHTATRWTVAMAKPGGPGDAGCWEGEGHSDLGDV